MNGIIIMMSTEYTEIEDIFPRTTFLILAITLIAADVAILACTLADIGTSMWQFYIMTLIVILVIPFCYFLKVRIVIEDGKLNAGILRMFTVPLDHVIDVKTGDIDILRNYSGWGIKKVRFKTFACPGSDSAVSVKLKGRIVLTVTTNDPEVLSRILMENVEAE